MKPYWQSSDGMLVVYHARFEDVLAAGLVPVEEVALIHDDSPYGDREQTLRRAAARGRPEVRVNGALRARPKRVDLPAVAGDERPFDARPLLALDRPTVIWGGHLCEPALPRSRAMLFWDKREASATDDNGDGEIAWSNLAGPIRRFGHIWRGFARSTERAEVHLHPTQKPVALSRWVFQDRAKLKAGDLVFVPHGGSGPDLPACRAMGLRCIWVDCEQWCCDVAIARLPEAPAEILERAKAFQRKTRAPSKPEPIGPLFGGVRRAVEEDGGGSGAQASRRAPVQGGVG